jgi:hypothetical protein
MERREEEEEEEQFIDFGSPQFKSAYKFYFRVMFLLNLDLFRFLEKTLDAGIKEAFVLAQVRFHASKQNGTLDEQA